MHKKKRKKEEKEKERKRKKEMKKKNILWEGIFTRKGRKLVYVWNQMRKCSHFINATLLSHFTVDYRYGWDWLSEFYLELLTNMQEAFQHNTICNIQLSTNDQHSLPGPVRSALQAKSLTVVLTFLPLIRT